VSAEGWDRADRDFEVFWRNMMDHERRENVALQEGYNEDLGLVD
jgi:hypothetical protein